jgi:hypothetical protein
MEMSKNHTKEEKVYWAFAKKTLTWVNMMVNRLHKYFDHDVGNVDTKFHGEKLIIGVKSLVLEAYHQMSTTGKEQLAAALGVQIQLIEDWILRPPPEPPPPEKSQKRGVKTPIPEKKCRNLSMYQNCHMLTPATTLAQEELLFDDIKMTKEVGTKRKRISSYWDQQKASGLWPIGNIFLSLALT